MIDGLIAGRLASTPERRIGKADSHYVIAKLKAHAADGEAYLVNVIAFDHGVAKELLSAHEGDSVALSGSLTPKVWIDKQGVSRAVLDMVAQRMLSLEPDVSRS
ncbi:MAG: single-stranded DNA-binding protein [Burkholderiales bacterium PBB4]|nr:MAG: single-stranded DNA-binding protein [Burkholderiales bacterium PBB4]